MKSKVAEEVRRETAEAMLALSPAERMDLALRLGEEAIQNFAEARGLSRSEAIRFFRRQSQQGRRYSRCIEELDGDASR